MDEKLNEIAVWHPIKPNGKVDESKRFYLSENTRLVVDPDKTKLKRCTVCTIHSHIRRRIK